MSQAEQEQVVSARVSRITLPVALATSLVVALAAPLTWFVLRTGEIRQEANREARRLALQLGRFASESPRLWRYNSAKVAHRLEEAEREGKLRVEVRDQRGRTLFAAGAERAAPTFWGRATVAVGVAIHGEVRVGLVETGLLLTTLLLLAGFSAAGFAVGAALYAFPLRTLRQAERELLAALAAQQQARAEADRLNLELERRVAEKTDHLLEAHRQLQRQEQRIRRLAAASLVSQEEERAAIAAELHDQVGQLLTAVRINLEAAASGRAGADLATLTPLLRESAGLVDETTELVRGTIRALGPPLLDQGGLRAAVSILLSSLERAPCRTLARIEIPEGRRLPRAVESCAFRVLQEGLTNAMRHAGAALVTVQLELVAEELLVTVADDGVGGARVTAEGTGLRTMCDRVSLLGGRFELLRREGGGTVLAVAIPLSEGTGEEKSDG